MSIFKNARSFNENYYITCLLLVYKIIFTELSVRTTVKKLDLISINYINHELD
mgnify:CR=1 FL=1